MEHNVRFEYDTVVNNVVFRRSNGKQIASQIVITQSGERKVIYPDERDLVFVTLGSNTENSAYGDQNTVPVIPDGIGPAWELWENIAAQDASFGNPKKFYGDIAGSNWESATINYLDLSDLVDLPIETDNSLNEVKKEDFYVEEVPSEDSADMPSREGQADAGTAEAAGISAGADASEPDEEEEEEREDDEDDEDTGDEPDDPDPNDEEQ